MRRSGGAGPGRSERPRGTAPGSARPGAAFLRQVLLLLRYREPE